MPLLNTESLLLFFLQKLNHDHNHNHKVKYQEHITQKFYRESIKLKTTLSYIMYIMNHETISYKTLIQELSIQYNCLTLSYTNQQIHVSIPVSRQLASSTQSLQLKFSQLNYKLPSLHMLISISTTCVIKSQQIAKLSLSPVISTGSPLDLTCM
jgi:hypothetical protein